MDLQRLRAWIDVALYKLNTIDPYVFSQWGIFIVPALFFLYSRYLRWRAGMPLFGRAGQSQARLSHVMNAFGLTPEKCTSGVAICGQTGSGKTSILKLLMVAILRTFCGCLWLCVKEDEAANARKVMEKAGREYINFVPGETRCNLFVYELTRRGGSPASLAQKIDSMDEIMQGGRGGKDGESFWRNIRMYTATLGIGVVWLAHRKEATFDHLSNFLISCASSLEYLKTEAYARSNCKQMLLAAERNLRTDIEKRMLAEAITLFENTLPSASEKVTGATVGHLTALLSPLSQGEMYSTVNCIESDCLPDAPSNGHCVIMDMAAVLNPGYQQFQILFGQMAIEAAIRRHITPESPIVAVVRDEYQMIANPRDDARFQTIARSQRLACFTAFQSLSVLMEAMSEPHRATHQSAALLGNHVTKIFTAQTDIETQEYFSKLTGRAWRQVMGGGQNPQQQQEDMLGVGGGMHMHFQNQLHPRKLPSALTNLKTGSEACGFVVSAYVHSSGQKFDNGLQFKLVEIPQDLSL